MIINVWDRLLDEDVKGEISQVKSSIELPERAIFHNYYKEAKPNRKIGHYTLLSDIL